METQAKDATSVPKLVESRSSWSAKVDRGVALQSALAILVVIAGLGIARSVWWHQGIVPDGFRSIGQVGGLEIWHVEDAHGVDLSKFLGSGLSGLKPTDEVLVAVMGGCGSCAAQKFKPGQEEPMRFKRVLLVYETPEVDLRKEVHVKEPYRAVADLNGYVALNLSLEFAPRLYVVNGLGVVTQAQTDWKTSNRMLAEKVKQ